MGVADCLYLGCDLLATHHIHQLERPPCRLVHHSPEHRRHLGPGPQIPRAVVHLDCCRRGHQYSLFLQGDSLQGLALCSLRGHRHHGMVQVETTHEQIVIKNEPKLMTRLICRSGKSATPTSFFNFFNLKRIVCAQKILNCYFLILN